MPATSKAGRTESERRDSGYTYPTVLIALASLSLALQAASITSASQLWRDREAELLFRGRAYRDAIASYHATGGVEAGRYPTRLQDLLKDPRVEGVRHIRRLYDDPMPGGGWRLVRTEGGGIVGVASTAPGSPRQRAFFSNDFADFSEADGYGDWEFVFERGGG